MQTVVIKVEKLVHGGQGIGTLDNGKKAFVWGVLPGETVVGRITKKRRDYVEAIADEILEKSIYRIEPLDEAYLSSSPWQIIDFDAENKYKKEILLETYERAGLRLPDFEFITDGHQFHYRNKMEYSFWASENGLDLALYERASRNKKIVKGSSISNPRIDTTAQKIVEILNGNNIRGSQLKSLMLRVSREGKVAAALFVKDNNFPLLKGIERACDNLVIYYSSPKSPASVITKKLHQIGDITLADKILGVDICYDVNSFFQINLPMFENALKRIDYFTGGSRNKIDMYSGVGAIGIPIGGTTTLIESDAGNIAMAKRNVGRLNIKVVHAQSEESLEHIIPEACIILDPHRAGLHTKIIKKLIEIKPTQIVYLSCNPATQARDIKFLSNIYNIRSFEGYNFFPRTPHIESLVVLQKA